MNSDDYFGGIVVGFVLGLLVSILLYIVPAAGLSKYKKAIEECEKSLPRDQHCKVIGVVDGSK